MLLLHVRIAGENVPAPVLAGVIVPEYTPFGVIVKLAEVTFTPPPVGPVKVYEVAGKSQPVLFPPLVMFNPDMAIGVELVLLESSTLR